MKKVITPVGEEEEKRIIQVKDWDPELKEFSFAVCLDNVDSILSGKYAAEVAKEIAERKKLEDAAIKKEKLVSNFMDSYFVKRESPKRKKVVVKEEIKEEKKEIESE